jgi:hypothetical protein
MSWQPPYRMAIPRGSSGGGGGGTSYNTNQTSVVLPPWVDAQAQATMAQAQTLSEQPYTAPPLPSVAGFTPDQTAAFSAVRGMQGVAPGQIGQAYGDVSNLPASTMSLLNPYMAAVAGDTTSNMLRASTAATQTANANAGAVGAFGGTRTGVQDATIASETQRNIGQATNQIAAQGWNTAMSTALQQGGLMGNLAQAGERATLTDASALAQTGQAQQTLQQAQYADALNRWQQQQNWPYQQLSVLQSALAGTPYGATVQSQQPYNQNLAAQYLGMAASAVPIASSIPSAINTMGSWFGNMGSVGNAYSPSIYGVPSPY